MCEGCDERFQVAILALGSGEQLSTATIGDMTPVL